MFCLKIMPWITCSLNNDDKGQRNNKMRDKTFAEELAHLDEPVKGLDTSNVVSLSLWRESQRVTPNSFIRSTLFSTTQSKDRQWLNQEIIYCEKGLTVKFTGQQLNQEDLALWETLVRWAHHHSLGMECTFAVSSLLTELGLSVGEKEREELHSGVMRLIACSVKFLYKKNFYFGSPVHKMMKDEVTDYYTVELNEKFIQLYEKNKWAVIFCDG